MLKYMLRLGAVVVGVLLLGVASCNRAPKPEDRSISVYPSDIKGEPRVRVLVTGASDRLSVSVTGPYVLRVKHFDGKFENGGGNKAVTVTVLPLPNGIKLGEDPVAEAEITPNRGCEVLVGGKPLPGTLILRSTEKTVGGKKQRLLEAIVRIGIEEYLAGVLPNEMSASWPLEALRAQAVAARTYALYHMKTRADKPWDVRSTVFSQVWKPGKRDLPRINKAVNTTSGVVMTEGWKLFPAYFHSQCGERTASGKPVFLKEDVTALSSVRCEFCNSSAQGRRFGEWKYSVSKADLSARLRKSGYLQGDLKNIRALSESKRVLDNSVMNRAYFIEVTSTTDVVQIVNANDFRLAVGHGRKELESTLFSFGESPDKKTLHFEGKGFGHGVGLCQYGAKYLAEQEGYTYDAILSHYYTGTRLTRLWNHSAGQ